MKIDQIVCSACGCKGIHACLGKRMTIGDQDMAELSNGVARVVSLDRLLMEYQGQAARSGIDRPEVKR